MSSTNRGAVRDTDDHYATPPDLALLIAQHLRDDWYAANGRPQPQIVTEPGCGEGAFMEASKAAWPAATVFGVELLPNLVAEAQRRGHLVLQADYLRVPLFEGQPDVKADLALTNPPFVVSQEFVHRTLPLLRPGGFAGFLQKLNWFGGLDRFQTMWKPLWPHFRHLYVLPARASYVKGKPSKRDPSKLTAGKKDSIEYGVFVWSAEPSSAPVGLSMIDNTGIANKLRGDEVDTSFVANPAR